MCSCFVSGKYDGIILLGISFTEFTNPRKSAEELLMGSDCKICLGSNGGLFDQIKLTSSEGVCGDSIVLSYSIETSDGKLGGIFMSFEILKFSLSSVEIKVGGELEAEEEMLSK